MVAEGLACLFEQIVGGAEAFDAEEGAAGFFGELLEVDFVGGLGKIRKFFDRFARGDQAKAGVGLRETLHQPRERRVLDALMLVLQRLHAIEEQQRLFFA